MSKPTIFSTRIKELHTKYNYTQKQMGNYLGISTRQYGYLEQGHFTCTYEAVIKLCAVYNVDANYLFGISKENRYPFLVSTVETQLNFNI